jgi:hypothetical protein
MKSLEEELAAAWVATIKQSHRGAAAVLKRHPELTLELLLTSRPDVAGVRLGELWEAADG